MSLPLFAPACDANDGHHRVTDPRAPIAVVSWPNGPAGWPPNEEVLVLERAETEFGALVLGPITILNDCAQCGLKIGAASVVVGPVRAPEPAYDGPIPHVASAQAGVRDVFVSGTAPLEITAGAFGRVVVGDGREPAALRLVGGRYVLRTLEVAAGSRLECSTACAVLVLEQCALHSGAYAGGSLAAAASALPLEIAVLGSADALYLGERSRVSARVFAPNGRTVLASGAELRGALVARSLRMGPRSRLGPARCLLAEHQPCAEGDAFDFALPLPERDDAAFHASGVGKQHALVAWKPGVSWNDIQGALQRVGGAITGALPTQRVTSVDFERPFSFEPTRAQRIAFQTVLGPDATAVDDLRREPSVAAAEYVLDTRPDASLRMSPFEPPLFDDGTADFLAVRPAIAFAGEHVDVAIAQPADDYCAFTPHLLPNPADATTTRFAITLGRQQQCTLDPDLREPPASADRRRVLVPLGNLPEGRYEVLAGPHRLSFIVLPGEGFGPELNPEVRVQLEVARNYWPQTCAGAAPSAQRLPTATSTIARLLRKTVPELEPALAKVLGTRAASVRVQRDGQHFSFTLREPACGATMEFQGRVTVEIGTAFKRLRVGQLALASQR